jgi:hypothetical protein
MKKSNHTLGPWISNGYYVVAPNASAPDEKNGLDRLSYENAQFGGLLICESAMKPEDGKLIAAAPQLAEALIGIINHIESKEYPLTGGDEIAVNDARAALTAAGYLNDESND